MIKSEEAELNGMSRELGEEDILKKYYNCISLLNDVYYFFFLLFFSVRYVFRARLGYCASVFDPDCVRVPLIIAG